MYLRQCTTPYNYIFKKPIRMNFRTLLLTIALILLSLTSLPSRANEGLELHLLKCVECHSKMTGGDGTLLYQRTNKIVRSITKLKMRVVHCSNGAQTGWDESQITTVTNFLNESFYSY